jgi:hypothetical protein
MRKCVCRDFLYSGCGCSFSINGEKAGLNVNIPQKRLPRRAALCYSLFYLLMTSYDDLERLI